MLGLILFFTACTAGSRKSSGPGEQRNFTGAKGEVKLMTLDPGHFHAALVQKEMYDQVSPVVYVYAPQGPDLQDHLARINDYNSRDENPTSWDERVYTGDDYLEKMLAEKPGNVVVISGNNAKKTDYILKSVQAGLNVLADKPMVISPLKFPELEQAFRVAAEKGVVLYDIMTERYEITTILQRELSEIPGVFGRLLKGTPDDPAIVQKSVHNIFKYVSGNALKRPAWFFDVQQQGEGMADVATHLVDLVQWEAFPEMALSKEDVEILSARHWGIGLTQEMFAKVTQLDSFPDFLRTYVENNILKYYCNGEINYKLRGVSAKVTVTWDFEAPEGTGDTHYAMMRGSSCNLVIRQGPEQHYQPTLYIETNAGTESESFAMNLEKAVDEDLALTYPGIKLIKLSDKQWTVEIPDKYNVGHEAHFAQVSRNYLSYLKQGHLPDWEVPDMIVKYYTTTEGLKKAME